jgi:hypothetical protein
MKNIIITIAFIIFWEVVFSQSGTSITDTVITLQEIPVFSTRGLGLLQPYSKKEKTHISVKGKSSVVSRVMVDKNSTYKIRSLEFFFNYQWQGFKEEGFYIKPLLLESENGKPGSPLFDDKTIYFVSKEINNTIHIDLTKSDVEISKVNSFFVGFEFTEKGKNNRYEDFNITMVPLKKSLHTSFIKSSCLKCPYTTLDLDDRNGLSLEYKIFYRK